MTRQVGRLLRPSSAADLGLDLDVDRVGCRQSDLGVGVRAVEVARVEVHAEIGALDGPDQPQKSARP